jgi:hypothetical protein
MEWQYVFLACAAIISLNFLLLLTYQEPGKAEREAELARQKASGAQKSLFRDSLDELRRPHVWPYLLVFSGFYFMFMSLFDILPAHIEDWVDTRDVVGTLFSGTSPGPITSFFVVMNEAGTEILPEGMLNLNSALIMTTCFLFAAISGRMRAITSMVVGTSLAAVALFASGASTLGWISVGAIGIFSVGEMLSSPKFGEYVGNFAPADKKGMYLGFSQISVALGWTLEGAIGPRLYDHFASKENFSRDKLMELGVDAGQVSQIPQGEGFDKLVAHLGQAPHEVTAMLYAEHNPGVVWYIMGTIGLLSAAGIWWYGKWVPGVLARQAAKAAAEHDAG